MNQARPLETDRILRDGTVGHLRLVAGCRRAVCRSGLRRSRDWPGMITRVRGSPAAGPCLARDGAGPRRCSSGRQVGERRWPGCAGMPSRGERCRCVRGELSSANVVSLTCWILFSMSRWSRTRRAISVASACSAVRSVTPWTRSGRHVNGSGATAGCVSAPSAATRRILAGRSRQMPSYHHRDHGRGYRGHPLLRPT